jgi:hypothetical protein
MEKQNRLQALQLKREEIKDKMALLGETGKWLDEGIKLRADLLQAEINAIVNARNHVYDAIDKLEKRMMDLQKLKADIEHRKAQERYWQEHLKIEERKTERPTTLEKEFEFYERMMRKPGKTREELFQDFLNWKRSGLPLGLTGIPTAPSTKEQKEKIKEDLGYGNE